MKRRGIAGVLLLGAALALTGCGQTATPTKLSVTYETDAGPITQKVSFDDLTCKKSSTVRVIVSASSNKAGKEKFLAAAPRDGRTHSVSIWFDGHWFTSISAFAASDADFTFDALPGYVSTSPDGKRPTSAGTEATLSGTIACGS
ncbi:MAG: hypothetical protein JST33_14970 [Actinobacteria bacterium]|nr:hypothetical protein [Actinomycetota bacterium]